MSQLKLKSEEEGVAVAEMGREIITNFLQKQKAIDVIPEIEDALRRVMLPYIERLLAITVHGSIAAGTAAWLSRAVLKQLTDLEVEEVWVEAVERSKSNLRRGTMLEPKEEVVDG
jgi:hypothetical protein